MVVVMRITVEAIFGIRVRVPGGLRRNTAVLERVKMELRRLVKRGWRRKRRAIGERLRRRRKRRWWRKVVNRRSISCTVILMVEEVLIHDGSRRRLDLIG